MPVSVHTRIRQNSTSMSNIVLDVNPQVLPIMAMGYIEACQPLPWHQSFDPGPYAWTRSGWRLYGSPSDETEPASSRSGETETASFGSGETEPAPKGSGETEPAPKGSDETEPATLRSGETKPAALGSGKTF